GSSTCFHSQSSSTTFSSADSRSRATAGSAPSLIVTAAVVCGTYTSAAAAPFVVPSASCTLSVMSTSWVRRSVFRVISCTPLSYETRAAGPALRSRARRVPRAGGPLHRGARRGVLPPLRGTEGDIRPQPDLPTPSQPDGARRRQVDRVLDERGRARAGAVEVRLRGLLRRVDARARREARRARVRDSGFRRRRGNPVPNGPPRDGERSRP